jgi:uncharacterized membrane protein YfcA
MKKTSLIPAKQRTNGRTIWAILFAVFATAIGFFAAGTNYMVLAIAAVAGAVIGYIIGKKMEKDASN